MGFFEIVLDFVKEIFLEVWKDFRNEKVEDFLMFMGCRSSFWLEEIYLIFYIEVGYE